MNLFLKTWRLSVKSSLRHVWEGSEYASDTEAYNIVSLELQTLPEKDKKVCIFCIYWKN